MQNIVTLGQVNDALKFTTVTAAQLAEMGFDALANKPICEALPQEESRRLRNAKLYPADSIGQIRVALAKRLAAPASCLLQIQEPAPARSLDALREAEAALEVAIARILKANPGHSISVTREAKALVAVRAALAAPAAVAVPDEREAFEAKFPAPPDCMRCGTGYASTSYNGWRANEHVSRWEGWQARAALAATPAAAPVVLPEPAPTPCRSMFATQREYADAMEQHRRNLAEVEAERSLLATGGQAQAVCELITEIKDRVKYSHARFGHSERFIELKVPTANKIIDALSAAPQAQADARDADGMYYLQDARWSAMVGNCPSWWRPDGNGYTTNLDEAERFTFEDALKQHRSRETDLPWLCSEVDKLRRPTVDCQYMPRSWEAQRESIAAIAAAKGE